MKLKFGNNDENHEKSYLTNFHNFLKSNDLSKVLIYGKRGDYKEFYLYKKTELINIK